MDKANNTMPDQTTTNSATPRWHARLAATLAWPRRREGRRELSQGFWVICDQAFISLASFLMTVVVGRIPGTGREELGVYALAVTTFWLLAGIPNSLVWTPYTSRAPRLSAKRRDVYAGSSALHMTLIALAMAGLILVAAMIPIPNLTDNDWFRPMCLALVPFTLMMLFREHIRRFCLTHLYTRDLLLIDIPIAALQLLLLLWLARWNSLTSTTALLSAAAACLPAVAWFYTQRHRFQFNRERAVVHWNYNLVFGRWLMAVSLAWLVADASYRWIVGWAYGLDALGGFAAAQTTVMFISPLMLTVQNFGRALSANRYARGGMAELRHITWHATLLVAATGGAAFLCLAAVGGFVVQFIYGSQYMGLGVVVATLSLGMFTRILMIPIDAAMVTLQQGRIMFIAMFAQLVAVVVAGFPLIFWIGLPGVGYAMALSSAVAGAIQWYTFLHMPDSASLGGDLLAVDSIPVPTL